MLKLVLRGLALLAGLEALVLATVESFEAVRRKFFWEQPPKEGFPWEEQPEIELESDGEKMKLYPDYGRLYEDMLAEIEVAEDYVFIETFIWQDDEVGRRFVDTLARKAREGVRVYAIFDELANLGQPASFKDFPEGVHTLRFRSFSGPADAINPRSLHRDHRKILSVYGLVSFVGGFNIGEVYTRWRGTHLRMKGATVHEVERAFAGFWNTHRAADLPEIPPVRGRSWNPATVFHSNDPYRHTFPVRDLSEERKRRRREDLHNQRLLHPRRHVEGRPDKGRPAWGGRTGSHSQALESRPRGLARPAAPRHALAGRSESLRVQGLHGPRKDRHRGQGMVHRGLLQRRYA